MAEDLTIVHWYMPRNPPGVVGKYRTWDDAVIDAERAAARSTAIVSELSYRVSRKSLSLQIYGVYPSRGSMFGFVQLGTIMQGDFPELPAFDGTQARRLDDLWECLFEWSAHRELDWDYPRLLERIYSFVKAAVSDDPAQNTDPVTISRLRERLQRKPRIRRV